MTRDSLHVSQRAYISVDATFNDKAIPVLQFRTFGNSPAAEVMLDDVQCSYEEALEPQASEFSGSSSEWEEGNLGRVLSPGTVITRTCPKESMGKASKYARVHGTVAYKDIFGQSHLTAFCYTSLVEANQALEACLAGNRTD